MDFGEHEAAAIGFHLEDAQIGDDEVNDAEAGDRQRAFLQNLRAAVFRRVLHHRDDALHAGDQVHRAARAFDHFAGNHPVRDVAFVGHFERAENGEIDVTAADLRKGIRAGEKGRAGHGRDGLFAGVDQIGVFFARLREMARCLTSRSPIAG